MTERLRHLAPHVAVFLVEAASAYVLVPRPPTILPAVWVLAGIVPLAFAVASAERWVSQRVRGLGKRCLLRLHPGAGS